jgi:hypothetical protein
MPYPDNAPRFGDLGDITIGDIAELPPVVLFDLHTAAQAETNRVKQLRDRLEAGIAQRYEAPAAIQRNAKGKGTGTVRLQDGPVTIVVDLPKKVDWDQGILADVVARIQANGDDPAEYLDVQYKVSERRYTAWPAPIRAVFEPARTVRPGKPKIDLLLQGGER